MLNKSKIKCEIFTVQNNFAGNNFYHDFAFYNEIMDSIISSGLELSFCQIPIVFFIWFHCLVFR